MKLHGFAFYWDGADIFIPRTNPRKSPKFIQAVAEEFPHIPLEHIKKSLYFCECNSLCRPDGTLVFNLISPTSSSYCCRLDSDLIIAEVNYQ